MELGYGGREEREENGMGWGRGCNEITFRSETQQCHLSSPTQLLPLASVGLHKQLTAHGTKRRKGVGGEWGRPKARGGGCTNARSQGSSGHTPAETVARSGTPEVTGGAFRGPPSGGARWGAPGTGAWALQGDRRATLGCATPDTEGRPGAARYCPGGPPPRGCRGSAPSQCGRTPWPGAQTSEGCSVRGGRSCAEDSTPGRG